MKVVHFYNGSGGGIYSVIKSLLRFSTDSSIENHIIHVVNKDILPDYKIEPVTGASSQQLCNYSGNNNFYHTCKQLAQLLPDDKALIVAHDWIELGMASNLGLQNPVVQIVHGNYDYYYELAARHSPVVDAYACISNKIYKSLLAKIQAREKDIFHLNFPVPAVVAGRKNNGSIKLVYFVGNLKDGNKQFNTVIEIAHQLKDATGNYFFTIAGGGMTNGEFFEKWPPSMKDRVNFIGPQTNENMMAVLAGQDIFLLPSLAEGLPVSLVEAMKAGAVPLLTDWEGGADELVTEGVTGYCFKPGAAIEYAECIKNLHANPELLQRLSDNAIKSANRLFDPEINTAKFEELFCKVSVKRINKKYPVKVYGSRLEERWIPNSFVKAVRQFKNRKRPG